jgi:hypothetical protein
VPGRGVRGEGQASKGVRWMPRRLEPTKDVASCEKPRGAARRRRSGDVRMGKPGGRELPSPAEAGGERGN